MLRWIPWICAYSGMRVSEAGNLRKEDFFEIGGRWFWKVTLVGPIQASKAQIASPMRLLGALH